MGKVAMINKQILFIFKIFKDKTKDEILDKLNNYLKNKINL